MKSSFSIYALWLLAILYFTPSFIFLLSYFFFEKFRSDSDFVTIFLAILLHKDDPIRIIAQFLVPLVALLTPIALLMRKEQQNTTSNHENTEVKTKNNDLLTGSQINSSQSFWFFVFLLIAFIVNVIGLGLSSVDSLLTNISQNQKISEENIQSMGVTISRFFSRNLETLSLCITAVLGLRVAARDRTNT